MSTIPTLVLRFVSCGLVSAVIFVAFAVPVFSGTQSLGIFLSVNFEPSWVGKIAGATGFLHGILLAAFTLKRKASSALNFCLLSILSTGVMVAVVTTIAWFSDFNWSAARSGNIEFLVNFFQSFLYNLVGWMLLLSAMFFIPTVSSGMIASAIWKTSKKAV